MGKGSSSSKLLRLLIYAVAIVLINIAGLTLFFRGDLTANRMYSISDVSQQVVSTLAEPLTIHAFFTKDLPAPYNNLERYLTDLLSEYAVHANKYFNYRFYTVSPEEGEIDPSAQTNRQLAENYGIPAIQIQAIDKDEVKFQKAYMGLVIIHGDMVERIPTITSVDGLEYQLTTAIQKLNNKISALAALEGKIDIKLFLSSSLEQVAPYIRLEQLSQVPTRIEQVVEKLNGLNFGKLNYQYLDPSKDAGLESQVEEYQLMTLNWPAIDNGKVPAGNGSIGLVLEHGDQAVSVPLLQVMNLPLIGTHYELADLDQMEEVINDNMESLIDINADLGWLAGNGTLPLQGRGPMGQVPDAAGTFNTLASQNYTLKQIDLKAGGIPESLNALIIARPTQPLNDWELYQIDQFLMKGKNIGLFLDAFMEVRPGAQQNMMFPNQGPQFVPLDTGIEKLLAHYGMRMNRSIVLDENCYKQQVPQQMGGGEQPLYFAPLIKSRNINQTLPFIKDIKGLVSLTASPLELDTDKIKANGLNAHLLFSSSQQSWEMRDQISLNPMTLPPPPKSEEQQQFPLAYLVEGEFPSYFDGKPIPEKPVEEKENPGEAEKDAEQADGEAAETEKPDPEMEKIKGSGQFIAKGKPGKIFLVGSSKMLTDSLLDEQGRGPNAVLVMNILDSLNGRENVAVMRSKKQDFNPLYDTRAGWRTAIKSFTIAGLPVLVVMFGLLVWFRRTSRKRHIQEIFGK
jgi:ABC-type uncharacterized transport system involved in gliding motility auxiliary subunit